MSKEEKKQTVSLWRVFIKVLFGLAVVYVIVVMGIAPPVGYNLSNTFTPPVIEKND